MPIAAANANPIIIKPVPVPSAATASAVQMAGGAAQRLAASLDPRFSTSVPYADLVRAGVLDQAIASASIASTSSRGNETYPFTSQIDAFLVQPLTAVKALGQPTTDTQQSDIMSRLYSVSSSAETIAHHIDPMVS